MKFIRLLSILIFTIICSFLSFGVEKADTVLTLGEVSVTGIKQSLDHRRAAGSLDRDRRGGAAKAQHRDNEGRERGRSNFYIPDYGSRMTSSIYVRGIGARYRPARDRA